MQSPNTAGPPFPTGNLHYAWVVAAATFLVLIVVAGIRATPGVLMGPIEHEMHWSAQSISAAAALNIALYGLVGPFAAALMHSIGVRRTVLIGLAVVATGIASGTFAREPWQLVATWGLTAGLGLGTLAMVLAATVANRWFVAQRGVVMGALMAATATGQLVFLPFMASLTETHGWRASAWVVASAAIAVAIPAMLFLRDRPSDVGVLPFGADGSTPVPIAVNNPFKMAIGALGKGLRTPSFWVLGGTFFICGASTNGLIGTHFINACGDHGIAPVAAASFLAAMGVFDLIGTTASGWLSDRVDNRLLLFMYYGLRGLSLLALPFVLGASWFGLSAFAVFYGLDWIATVPPTVRLTTQEFGTEEAPIVYGWIVAAHQLGASAIALGAGAIRTQAGTYSPAFEISGILCIAAAFAIFALRDSRRPQLVTAAA